MHRSLILSFAFVVVVLASQVFASESVWLSALDVSKTQQDWGKPQADKSVDGHTMSIAGTKYEHGLGTHAVSLLYIDLNGGSTRFTAMVGVDDEVTGKPIGIRFSVIGDGRDLWKSGVMKKGQPAEKVDVDVSGVKTLRLVVENEGDNINYDHADWADAKFEVSGERPATIAIPRRKVVLTPKPPATPRINGPRVFGVRPGHPFLFAIAATGDRPMEFAADDLPAGLKVDAATGLITGVLRQRGEYVVSLHATNDTGRGRAEAQDRLRRHDRPDAADGLEQLELLRRRRRRRQSPLGGRRDGPQRAGPARLDVHQHRRLLGDQAGQQRPAARWASRATPME